ncbi:hypothetical protein CspeluHIS016_0106410 [Cutaneotrichosporon spelunceum]|uniref:NAD-dependent epimerase/dehydratase domain-containing protein n=1 Tax=Cutaneotrichosporon spelunceum TaxID=1672016 RepID=A0AAD3TPK4_9TREE|nr:hypothetical protein CspeluHIS016_0106410 [Cutaneotrichosporon spelunceum]
MTASTHVPAKGSLILVTGASGYIASWITLYLLEQGFSVRGTTRTATKGQWMKGMYAARGFDGFEYTVVSDLENEDAFGDAARGVDAIIHTASPFHWNVTTPDDFIKPAVAGTLSALRAASAAQVRRVVITSSYASILENKEPLGEFTFTEDDWNQQSIDEVEAKGTGAWRMHWYRASKTLAERAAWKYVEDNTPPFDVVTICPPYVLGPLIHDVPSPDALNTSAANWYAYLSGQKSADDAIAPAGILCDVRDVARAHVRALLLPEAGGQRFGVATRTFTIQTLLDHVTGNDKLMAAFPDTVRGPPGKPVPPQNWFDCSHSLKVLGIELTHESKTAIDMTESLVEKQKGWSKPV